MKYADLVGLHNPPCHVHFRESTRSLRQVQPWKSVPGIDKPNGFRYMPEPIAVKQKLSPADEIHRVYVSLPGQFIDPIRSP